jgi:hypothetical protein
MAKAQRRHNKRAYRSGSEGKLSELLSKVQKEVRYEKLKVEWEDLQYRTYTPDFELDNGIIIEYKGLFEPADRRKHLHVRAQHPDLDIRFVFYNAAAKINKGSKTTYAMWADKYGFKWSHKVVPDEWLTEPGKPRTETKILYKQEKHETWDTRSKKTK